MKISLAVALVCACACVCVAAAFPHESEHHAREPRSPQEKKKDDGGWSVKADQTRNGGTVVRAEAQKKWDVTDNGKVQAEVHGHWERTYGGPNNGQRDRGAGGSIGGSWGK